MKNIYVNKNDNLNNVKLSPLVGIQLYRNKIINGPNYPVESLLQNIIEPTPIVSKKTLNNKFNSIKKISNKIITKSNLNLINNNKSQLILNFKDNTLNPISLMDNNNLISTVLNQSTNKELLINENKNSLIMRKNKFIKSITEFNSKLASYTNIFYNFSVKKRSNQRIKNIYSILYSSFLSMSSLISKPVFLITPFKVKIKLFFFWNPRKKRFKWSKVYSKFLILNTNKLKILLGNLSLLLKKPVELEITRLYYPQYDSNILSNLIGLISNIIKFRFIRKRLFRTAKIKNPTKMTTKLTHNKIPSFLSGINLKLAGRILTQRLKRRVKSKIIQRGSLARTKATLVTSSRFTNKNKRGSFSITVTTGHLVLD